jgi:hypothetical protein
MRAWPLLGIKKTSKPGKCLKTAQTPSHPLVCWIGWAFVAQDLLTEKTQRRQRIKRQPWPTKKRTDAKLA